MFQAFQHPGDDVAIQVAEQIDESENSQPDLALNCPLLAKSPEPPCQVLDEIAAFIQKFVILNASEVQVISLWIAHTIHTVPSHVQVSPLRLKLSSRPPNNST